MDIKLIIASLAIITLIGGYYPYISDIFRKKTKPHAYTWLIWTITQGTATAGALYGGAGWGALSLSTGTLLVASVFFLSLRYGARSITNSDTVILFLSLSAVGMWRLTNNPLYSVLMVTAIDAMGYVPTLRKSWDDPWSETLLFWLAMAVGSLLSILSLDEINWLTAPYLITLATLNTVVLLVCKFRRNSR